MAESRRANQPGTVNTARQQGSFRLGFSVFLEHVEIAVETYIRENSDGGTADKPVNVNVIGHRTAEEK